MKVATGFSILPQTEAAAAEAFARMREELDAAPHFLIVHCSIQYDAETVSRVLNAKAPGVPLHGGTSCLGVMSEKGFHSEGEGRGLGVMGIHDPDGAYGTGVCDIQGNARNAVMAAARAALKQAGRPGESPAVVLFMSYTGVEESVIDGIEELFGPNVPIAGGSAADNSVNGEWKQLANCVTKTNAVVVSVLFPSVRVAFGFHNGYDVTEHSATITRGEGRLIQELDGKPAAEVYNEWSGGTLNDLLKNGGSALWQTTFHPLGRIAADIQGAPMFQLSLLDVVTKDRGLTVFADIKQGDRVYYMAGSEEGLVARAKRVVQSAIRDADTTQPRILGAFMFFCAGCMMTIKGKMPEVAANLNEGLGSRVPFLCAFTFGEQGRFYGGRNRHGNLMVSLLLLIE